MNDSSYITVKIFCWIVGILITLFIVGTTGINNALSARVNENSKDIKANTKLIYENQLIIVELFGDIKSSIANLK